MATSAFKSTTKRASVGGSSSESSSTRSLRRSRSLSRFSRPILPETEPEYNKDVPRGKFVNTKRGSEVPVFPEISLDDLALEFFSSSSLNENESDGGKGREGTSVSRRGGGEIGRWASDTASSRRRGRSVSRSRGAAVAVASTEGKKVIPSSAAGSRRRRSLSVARYHQISDSESEVDHSRSSSNRANAKVPVNGNRQISSVPKGTNSSNRQRGRSQSRKDLSVLHDDYSSHSSVLTDEESKDSTISKNGFEKIIRAVYSRNKAEHPTKDVADGGLYEAMRKELRYAVQEIRTELNQAMGGNPTASPTAQCLQPDNFSAMRDRNGYATKSKQFEKHKETELLLAERGRVVSEKVKKLPGSRTSDVAEKPSRGRKKSTDRNKMSRRLDEEAERYFEDFLSNVEDTDISSFDGERSDGSSTLGGTIKARNVVTSEAQTYKSPAGSSSRPVEMDGLILPWLQWETSGDGSLSGKNKPQTPVTPKSFNWDSEKENLVLYDPTSYSASSHGSWSPGLLDSLTAKRGASGKNALCNSSSSSSFDMDDYLKLGNNDELLFEMYRERNRISSGGLLLCRGVLF